MIKIEKADNGFILRTDVEDEIETLVFGYDDFSTEQDAFGALIHSIAERCGFLHNKFRGDNLKISWDGEGNKYIKPENNESN